MIIVETPLRIGFAGGGTDLPEYYREFGGHVINCAIDKYIYVIVKERFDDDIYINYSRKEIVSSVDQIEHELVREAMRIAGVKKGIEITTLADIPSAGSGLGSSSSVTVGLLHALHLYKGINLATRELADLACEIELSRLGKAMGKQDAFIAAFGGVCDLRFGTGDHVAVAPIALEAEARHKLERRLMLFYSGITRSAEPILDEQRRNTYDRLSELERMSDLAEHLSRELAAGRIEAVGEVVRAGWEAKQALSTGINTEPVAKMIDAALQAGAEGAKVCGAGGGGFVLVVCSPENQASVRARLADYRHLPIHLAPSGSRAVFNIHRETWN